MKVLLLSISLSAALAALVCTSFLSVCPTECIDWPTRLLSLAGAVWLVLFPLCRQALAHDT